MKKKFILPILSLLVLNNLVASCSNDNTNIKLQSFNSQAGVILGNKNYSKKTTINGNEIKSYLTYSKNITLKFDTYHVDTNYKNKLIINDIYEYDLVPSNDSFETYHSTEVNLLGLNIIDGSFKVKFVAGTDHTNTSLDTFYVRNVVLEVGNQEIWSNEYEKDNFLNEKIGLGESTINSDKRFGITPERSFTYEVGKTLLDCRGYLFSEKDYKDEIIVETNEKEYKYDNPLQSFALNIKNNEVIKETRILEITSKNTKNVRIFMDGVEIYLPLTLTSSCWVAGKHNIYVEATDEYGSKLIKSYDFTLEDYGEPNGISTYKVFNNGVSNNLPNSIGNLGIETTLNSELITPFSDRPFINFEITNNSSHNIVWKGLVNKNRVAFLQLYNYVDQRFDTLATKQSGSSDEEIVLATNYSSKKQYISNGKTIARVSSTEVQKDFSNPSGTILHLSDVQYIVEKSAAQGDSILGKEAKKALVNMNEYVIANKPDYAWISGDLVQGTVDEQEWKDVVEYLVDPILDAEIPLGLSSGNHDVGGISAVNVNGTNGLDEALVYDYFSRYVGEEKFSDNDYYGGSFENNRSHYDLVDISGHEFLFLHLGWGSSFYGIHVSSKDIQWAKNILEKYPNKTVVLSTHEYLNAKGERNATGAYVFEELVKAYSNIKFVFSGHVNGSSVKIDLIDDNKDGMNDRKVLQLLTDYQEEENLYGATFIRLIKLYSGYGNILFDIYSPFYCDNDIIVFNNPDIVKYTSRFEYAFDIANDGFGLITKEFK